MRDRARFHRVRELCGHRKTDCERDAGVLILPNLYHGPDPRSQPYNPETFHLPIFLLLFVGIPLIELYFLIQVGSEIGALRTIGLSILTAFLGASLVRMQGFGVLMRAREAASRDEVPALELMNGALILVAGLMLLLPGFFTDAVGFLLLIPPLRRLLIARYVQVVPHHNASDAGPDGPKVIEGEFRREKD